MNEQIDNALLACLPTSDLRDRAAKDGPSSMAGIALRLRANQLARLSRRREPFYEPCAMEEALKHADPLTGQLLPFGLVCPCRRCRGLGGLL